MLLLLLLLLVYSLAFLVLYTCLLDEKIFTMEAYLN